MHNMAEKLPVFTEFPPTKLGEEKIWNLTVGDVISFPRLRHRGDGGGVMTSYRKSRDEEVLRLPRIKLKPIERMSAYRVPNRRREASSSGDIFSATNLPRTASERIWKTYETAPAIPPQERPLTESGNYASHLAVALTTPNKDEVAYQIEQYLQWKEKSSMGRVRRDANRKHNDDRKEKPEVAENKKAATNEPKQIITIKNARRPNKVEEFPPILEVQSLLRKAEPTTRHKANSHNSKQKEKTKKKKLNNVVAVPHHKKFEKLNWRLPAKKVPPAAVTTKQKNSKNYIQITSASIDLGSMTSQNKKSTLQVSIAVAKRPKKP